MANRQNSQDGSRMLRSQSKEELGLHNGTPRGEIGSGECKLKSGITLSNRDTSNPRDGVELMKERHGVDDKDVVPEDNLEELQSPMKRNTIKFGNPNLR